MISEWKLKLIAYVLFDRILSEREQIIETINELLDKSIKDEEIHEKSTSELEMYKKRLEDLTKKNKKLLDAYMNELISKDEFSSKKSEYDNEIIKIKNFISELTEEKYVPKQTFEQKIKGLKDTILDNFNYKSENMSDELVESFVDKIIIDNDLIEWHLNFINDKIISIREERKEILIAELAITDDDAIFYSKYFDELKRIKIKEPLRVAIYL